MLYIMFDVSSVRLSRVCSRVPNIHLAKAWWYVKITFLRLLALAGPFRQSAGILPSPQAPTVSTALRHTRLDV